MSNSSANKDSAPSHGQPFCRPFISLQHYKEPSSSIDPSDFTALKKFEARHPELYHGAEAPRVLNTSSWYAFFEAKNDQERAYEAVFSSPEFGEEFKDMVCKEREAKSNDQ